MQRSNRPRVYEVNRSRIPSTCLLVFVVAAIACTTADGAEAESGGGSTAALDSSSTSTVTTSTSTTATDSSSAGDESSTTGGVGVGGQCDAFEQDCAEGLKCMYGCDGAACSQQCRPVRPDAVGLGEPCTAEALDAEFPDDCDARSLCWTGEAEAGAGICEPFCVGSPSMPACDDAGRVCAQQSVCLERCDPLLQACPDAQGCFDVDVGAFVCWNLQDVPIPDGEPCGGNTLCRAGATCVFADSLATCTGARCCTPLCEIGADEVCAAVDASLACVAYDVAVPRAPELGVCVLPN